VLLGAAGAADGLAALAFGALFLLVAFAFRSRPDRAHARRVVVASVLYLPLVLAALMLDVSCAAGEDQAVCAECVGPEAGTPAAPDGRATDDTGLPDHGPLPEFTLVDDEGRPFSRTNLLGHVWVVDFIFTRCAVTCGEMSDVYARLMREGLTARFLSVTVDPRNDGPEQLVQYRARYGGSAPAWRLLTGRAEDIQVFAEVGFRLPVNAGAEEVAGMPPLFHSGKFALLDQSAHVRGYYDYRDELDLQRLRQHVARLAEMPPDAGQ
jgi:protein SCO1/2